MNTSQRRERIRALEDRLRKTGIGQRQERVRALNDGLRKTGRGAVT